MLTKGQKIVAIYFFVLVVYWVVLNFSGKTESTWNYLYSFLFSLTPLLGGLVGADYARFWGFTKSAIGRAILYTSLGLFSWGAGSMIWSYYNFFLNVPAPYPSISDVGFIGSIPLWMVGIINLSKATGAKFGLRHIRGRFFILAVPILVISVSYYLLVIIARDGFITNTEEGILKVFFDLAYPISDVVILTTALIIFGLSLNYFGGKYKVSILAILFGFFFMYIADFIFSYTTTQGTFYNGSFGDLIFTIALSLLTFGLLGFNQLKGK